MFQPHFEAFRPERGFGQRLEGGRAELARRLLSYRTQSRFVLPVKDYGLCRCCNKRVLAHSRQRFVCKDALFPARFLRDSSSKEHLNVYLSVVHDEMMSVECDEAEGEGG